MKRKKKKHLAVVVVNAQRESSTSLAHLISSFRHRIRCKISLTLSRDVIPIIQHLVVISTECISDHSFVSVNHAGHILASCIMHGLWCPLQHGIA